MKDLVPIIICAICALAISLLIVGIVTGYVSIDLNKEKAELSTNVIFSDSVINELKLHYNTDVEFGGCLDGYLGVDKNYYVNKVESMVYGDDDSVAYHCDGLVNIHSHPKGSCFSSAADVQYWKKYEAPKGVLLFMIMCTPNKILIFDKYDYSEGKLYELQ